MLLNCIIYMIVSGGTKRESCLSFQFHPVNQTPRMQSLPKKATVTIRRKRDSLSDMRTRWVAPGIPSFPPCLFHSSRFASHRCRKAWMEMDSDDSIREARLDDSHWHNFISVCHSSEFHTKKHGMKNEPSDDPTFIPGT